jgi:hypothetical protein
LCGQSLIRCPTFLLFMYNFSYSHFKLKPIKKLAKSMNQTHSQTQQLGKVLHQICKLCIFNVLTQPKYLYHKIEVVIS